MGLCTLSIQSLFRCIKTSKSYGSQRVEHNKKEDYQLLKNN